MVQFLSIFFFYFFNFCWVFQKFPFFCVTLYNIHNIEITRGNNIEVSGVEGIFGPKSDCCAYPWWGGCDTDSLGTIAFNGPITSEPGYN